MVALPWQGQEIEEQRDYVVMASLLPLKQHRSIPGFMRDTLAIRRQLSATAGLVGYALRAELARKTFWTFSVWADRESLDTFASSNPHAEIIRNLQPKMQQTVFRFVEVGGSQLPWNWETVRTQLESHG